MHSFSKNHSQNSPGGLEKDEPGSYLAHHGVLGMKWGVHNEETMRKYGEIKRTPGVLPKGYELKRITNTSEMSKMDKSKRLYAVTNEEDFKTYAKLTKFLPSTIDSGKMVSVLSMRLKEDAKFADGETSVKMALEKSLNKTLDEFANTDLKKKLAEDYYGEEYYRSFKEYSGYFKAKNSDTTLRNVLKSSINSVKEKDPEGWRVANELVNMAVGGTVGSFAKPKYQKQYLDKAKKKYDIITDPEDASAKAMEDLSNLKEPVIVLNPEKTIGDISEAVVKRKDLEKYANRKDR